MSVCRSDLRSDIYIQFTNKICQKFSLDMTHGAFNMIRNKTMQFAIETVYIPTNQESWYIGITNEDNAHHFLFTLNSFRKAKIWPNILCGNIEAVTWSCA
jgi:hypothetical protein